MYVRIYSPSMCPTRRAFNDWRAHLLSSDKFRAYQDWWDKKREARTVGRDVFPPSLAYIYIYVLRNWMDLISHTHTYLHIRIQLQTCLCRHLIKTGTESINWVGG